MKILGALILASPFIALSAYMVIKEGWRCLFFVWGVVISTLCVVLTGIHLLLNG